MMNLELLRNKLLQTARRSAVSDDVPSGFESRVLARLSARPPGLIAVAAWKEEWSAIARTLWWAAGACTGIAVAMSVWTHSPDRPGDNFADDLEETILASVDEEDLDLEFDSWQ
jgi:hypothetical protein